MVEVKRQIGIVTKQHIIKEAESDAEFPIRRWSMEVYMVSESGQNIPATVFEKVTYKLHESFGKRATQVVRTPPFKIEEEGWGEFEAIVTVTPLGNPKGGETTIVHDLNFREPEYTNHQPVTFRNPKPELAERLRESGPVADAGAGTNGTAKAPAKKKTGARTVDMEKLASGMERLGEDDLLHVVQLVHDNKSDDTYMKNDVENGEFHVDLYTLPDALIKMLWDFVSGKVDMSSL